MCVGGDDKENIIYLVYCEDVSMRREVRKYNSFVDVVRHIIYFIHLPSYTFLVEILYGSASRLIK